MNAVAAALCFVIGAGNAICATEEFKHGRKWYLYLALSFGSMYVGNLILTGKL